MPSKKSDLQIYADECFPFTTVIYLRSLGYSIKHASEYNFLNKPDILHLRYAKKLGKTLITLDRDFLGYTAKQAINTHGILVVKAGSNYPSHINLICMKQLKKLTRHSTKSKLISITVDKVKVVE